MIAIIDYDAGNLTSVARAVSHLGFAWHITNDIDEISKAERIIFPGVGAAGAAMDSLQRLGLDSALETAFRNGKPILGICLGCQIVLSHSLENDQDCLGLMEGRVERFDPESRLRDGSRIKIPHMGWNQVRMVRPHPVLAGMAPEDEFYFVHGYYPEPADGAHVLGTTDYGVFFASVIGCRNLIATQFHLEKSGRPGLRLLRNFCTWKP
jgi:glutamine amidotransferase